MSEPSPPAVLVDGVSKTFRIPHEAVHTLKERALHPFRSTGYQTLHSLRDVSFAVEPGEFFGIVGRNGSGKSTLLKCMAGIYATDQGRIYVSGPVSSFIELGVGFNPDLAARDNVMINATMLGLSPREARRRFDAVIDFAELRDFVDLKIKNYSSGMLVRLAFAVMIQVDADILLIDEVLAVGDAAFQQKCYDEFANLRKRGATVLLVTHDMAAVRRFCDRAMLLERGGIVEIGDTPHVSERYLELNFSEEARASQAAQAENEPTVGAPTEVPAEAQGAPAEEGDRWGDGKARITDAWFEDEYGQRTAILRSGRRYTFVARVRFAEAVEDPLFGVDIRSPWDAILFVGNNIFAPPSGTFAAGDEATYRIAFTNVLAPGHYHASPAVAHGGAGNKWIDRPVNMITVTSTSTQARGALVDTPFEFELERAGAPAAAEGAAS